MEALTIPNLPASGIDWPSVFWVLLLACITAACLWIKSSYSRIAEMGAGAAAVANIAIGYFSVAMLAFGATCAVRARLPVPGGLAWEGPVAVIGGLAACVIGGSTLVEHALRIRDRRRAAAPAAMEAVGARAGMF